MAIIQGDYVTLTDGATVATDASLGDYFYLTGVRSSRTMSNPTNGATGEEITYVIENTGGAVTTSWGTAFKLAGTWTDPSPDRARSITFFNNGTYWVETTRTGADLKLSADPTDVASLVGWWDAGLLTLSDADAVTSWPARYGQGPLIAPATTAPTFKASIQNSKGVVRFDGTDDFLSVGNPLDGETACSAFAVFAKGETSSTSLRTLVDIANTGVQGAVWFENTSTTANRVQGSYGTGSTTGSCTATTVGTAFHQWSWIVPNAGTPKLYKDAGSSIDGTATSSLSFATSTLYVGSNIGTQRFMNGDLAELILYSTALGDSDRATVATYLKNKWGTP